ncbi:MAG TPA: DHH family phosphoesterase, partial [bacterium]|nr:DHH family phosphoesterase [bacterium]
MDNNKQTKQKIYIIGHKNPDTDSIASAIAYSDLKQRLGWDNVRPARAGIMNQQTSYILQKLNIKPPVIISDIRTRVCEVMIEEPIFIKYKDTLKTAFNLLDKNTIR